MRDWRVGQLAKLDNAHLYRESRLRAAQILEFGRDTWRSPRARAGGATVSGARTHMPIHGFEHEAVLTPDDLMDGRVPQGPVVVFDDDHYYLGGVLAEACVRAGLAVTLVTPAPIDFGLDGQYARVRCDRAPPGPAWGRGSHVYQRPLLRWRARHAESMHSRARSRSGLRARWSR